MSELKPCPFCGGEAHLQNEFNDYIDSFRIICDSCFCSTNRYWCEDEAAAVWNTRAETEAEKKIEQIRAECERRLALHRGMNESMMAIEDHAYHRILDILEEEK